jgi:gamma-glutamylcyclotransferase (GGCT)/AIG2-like uncharacterized protein YtfP
MGKKDKKEMLKVVVYGSLRRGMGNHRLLERSELLSTEVIQANYDMLDMGSYPGLVRSEEPNDIVVEVYSVTPETFTDIEHLEGYPSFYNRENVRTTEGDAPIYFLEGSDRAFSRSAFVSKIDDTYDWVKYRTLRSKSW